MPILIEKRSWFVALSFHALDSCVKSSAQFDSSAPCSLATSPRHACKLHTRAATMAACCRMMRQQQPCPLASLVAPAAVSQLACTKAQTQRELQRLHLCGTIKHNPGSLLARALPTIRQLTSYTVAPNSSPHTPPPASPVEHPALVSKEVTRVTTMSRHLLHHPPPPGAHRFIILCGTGIQPGPLRDLR